MLRKSSRLLAVLLAVIFAITTFGSDFSNAKVFAADEDTAETIELETEGDEIKSAEWEEIPSEGSSEDSSEGLTVTEQPVTQEEANEEANAVIEEPKQEQADFQTIDQTSSDAISVNDGGSEATSGESSEDVTTNDETDEAATDETALTTDKTLTDADETLAAEGKELLTEEELLKEKEEKEKEAKEKEAKEKEAKEKETPEVVYPAQSFEDYASGINVSVSAEEGALPEGTKMVLTAISDTEAVAVASDVLDGDVLQAKGIDISFRTEEDVEIEPLIPVSVSISLDNSLAGDSFSVIHKADDGSVEKIGEAESDGAIFVSDFFSVYIVAGEGDSSGDTNDKKAIATFNFYLNKGDTTPYNTQLVKIGDNLADPGCPPTGNNQEFIGWFNDGGEQAVFNTAVGAVNADHEINYYAKINTSYYIMYMGVDGDIVHVQKHVATGKNATEMVNVDDFRPVLKRTTQDFLGWSENPNGSIVTSVDAMTVRYLYPIVTDAVWITFNENNGGVGTVVTNLPLPILTNIGDVPKAPTAIPKRDGYTFVKWTTDPAGTKDFDFTKAMTDSDGGEEKKIVLYAQWKENDTAPYTVIIWTQKNTADHDKTYNTDGTLKGGYKGDKSAYEYLTNVSVDGEKNKNIDDLVQTTEFKNKFEKIAGYGFNDAWTWYDEMHGYDIIRFQGDTIINLYFDRVERIIEFRLKSTNGLIRTLYGLYDGPREAVFPVTDAVTAYSWVFKDVLDLDKKRDEIYIEFLNTFNFDTIIGKGEKTLTLYFVQRTGEALEYHFMLEKLDSKTKPRDERYVEDTNNMVRLYGKVGSAFQYNCDDYYEAFKPVEFEYQEYNTSTGKFEVKKSGEVDLSDPDKSVNLVNEKIVTGGNKIYIYFNRVEHYIDYKESYFGVTTDIAKSEMIQYEKALAGYKTTAPTIDKLSVHEGYKVRTDADGNVIWYLDPMGTYEYKWNDTMPLSNKLLYAYYDKILCTVTLNAHGGTFNGLGSAFTESTAVNGKGVTENIATTKVYYGDAQPTKTFLEGKVSWAGHEFIGWNCEGKAYGFGAVVRDITLDAMWRRPGDIRVVYDGNGHGTDVPVDTYKYSADSSVVVGASPKTIETGYTFLGWRVVGDTTNTLRYPNGYFAIDEEKYVSRATGIPTITLLAIYSENGKDGSSIVETTIVYHSNDGRALSLTVSKGKYGNLRVNESVISLSLDDILATGVDFRREGYTFRGWSKYPGENNAFFVGPGTRIAADNESLPNNLYAIWEPNQQDNPPEDPPTDDGNYTPTTPTPIPVQAAAVLGERREPENKSGAAVLGARRSGTGDNTNIAGRVIAILLAAFAAAGLIVLGKRKEEQEEN